MPKLEEKNGEWFYSVEPAENFPENAITSKKLSEGVVVVLGKKPGKSAQSVIGYRLSKGRFDTKDKAQEWVDKNVKAEDIHRNVNYFSLPIEPEAQMPSNMVFEKELIREGEWTLPSDNTKRFEVTAERMMQWIVNFHKGLLPEGVMITLGHNPDPMKAVGLLEDIYRKGTSLMGRIRILLEDVGQRIGTTIRGVSLGVDLDYKDTETGEKHGEVIWHVALTNEPHIKGMEPFHAVLASRHIRCLAFEYNQQYSKSNGPQDDDREGPTDMELKEQLEAEKAKSAELLAKNTTLSEKNVELTTQHKTLSDSEKEKDAKIKEQETQITKQEFTAKVDGLVAEGKILPKDRDNTISLLLDAVSTKVQYDGKEVRLADKLFLSYQAANKQAPLGGPKGKGNNEEGNDEAPELSELTVMKDKLVMGTITHEQYEVFEKDWREKAMKTKEVQSAGREVFAKTGRG